MTVLLALDDATGTVPYALFREQEDTQGYLLVFQGVIARWGIPLTLRTASHAVFQHRRLGPEEASTGGAGAPTQFGRALQEIGVTPVFAHSPEAKGRVERANGTFQGLPEPAKGTDWWRSCAWRAPARSWRRAPCLESFCPASMSASVCPRQRRDRPIVNPTMDWTWTVCSASRRRGAWRRIIPCSTTGAPCSVSPGPTGPAMPGPTWRSKSVWTGGSWCPIEESCRLRRTHHPWQRRSAPKPAPLRWPLRRRGTSCTRRPRSASRAHGLLLYPVPWRGTPSGTRTLSGRASMPNWCGPAWSGPGRRAGVSRPTVIEREGFLKHFAAVVERLGDGSLSRRKAAKELDIGYATLKRLIDARLAVVRQGGMIPR